MTGSWPATREWLEANGFEFVARRKCSGRRCGMTIEFWRSPRGAQVPLNIVAPNNAKELTVHWEVCPDEKDFRTKPAPEPPIRKTGPKNEETRRAVKVVSGNLFD